MHHLKLVSRLDILAELPRIFGAWFMCEGLHARLTSVGKVRFVIFKAPHHTAAVVGREVFAEPLRVR
jgi:hypothetical protein